MKDCDCVEFCPCWGAVYDKDGWLSYHWWCPHIPGSDNVCKQLRYGNMKQTVRHENE